MSEKKQLKEKELLNIAGGAAEDKRSKNPCAAYNDQKNTHEACRQDPRCRINSWNYKCVMDGKYNF